MNGFGGQKRQGATAFVIDGKAYVCGGQNNNSDVSDFWRFDPSAATPWTQLRDIANTSDDDYDDDYDYSDDELAENERLADTEQADVQAEAFDTEADENEAAGTENDAADSGDEQ